MQELLVGSKNLIDQRKLDIANKIFADRFKYNKTLYGKSLDTLTTEFNNFMKFNGWQVDFHLSKPNNNNYGNNISIKDNIIIDNLAKAKKLNNHQKTHLMYSAIALKSNGVEVTIPRLKAILAIREQENSLVLDSGKLSSEVESVIKKFESEIKKLKFVLDDKGDKYLDSRINQLKTLINSKSKILQYELYERSNQFMSDYKNNNSGFRDSLDKTNTIFYDLGLSFISFLTSDNKIKKYDNEKNSDCILRLLTSKPETFGKYEINVKILAQRIKADLELSPNIKNKVFPVGKFDRNGLILSMLDKEGASLNQIELEYLYQKYFFIKGLSLFDNNNFANLERLKYMGIDHNAGEFASRNSAIQNALNKKLGCKLKIDGDLTKYDDNGNPKEDGLTYKQLKIFCKDNNIPSCELNLFVKLSRQSGLIHTSLYKILMSGIKNVKMSPDGNSYGDKLINKFT